MASALINTSFASSGIMLGAISTIILLVVLIKTFRHPLRKVPGPFWARYTRLWYLHNVWRGDFQKTNIQLHNKYGPIVRIAPNEYSLDGPEAIKTIYGHGTHFIKGPWYLASAPIGMDNNLFTDFDIQRHAANRRKVSGLYSMTTMLKWEHYSDESARMLISQFEKLSSSSHSINLQLWLQYFAFDTISLITLGKSFGLVESGCDANGFLDALHAYLTYSANVGVYSEFHPILGRLLALLPSKGMAWMFNFVQNQCRNRINAVGPEKFAEAEENDFLGTILRMHGQNPNKILLDDVSGYSLTNIGAGSDTTSVSLASIIYHLITAPEKLKRVREEIQTASARGQLSELIKFSEAQQMPYLQACIKEGLRMHPATGLPLARVVPNEGVNIQGTYFPGGTVVGVNSWVAHANKAVFGPDADQFRPERWLENKEQISNMERCFLAFGAGSRTCVGKNISLMEISKIVPELLRRFDFALVDPKSEIAMENVWFVKQKNLDCYISAYRGAREGI